VADRILATAPSNVAAAGIELQIVNNSGASLTDLLISYDIVRLSAVSTFNELPGYSLFFSLDNGGTWTNVSALNPTASGSSGVLVPNSIGVTAVSNHLFSLGGAWVPGSTLRLRWIDDNADQTSPDQIIGLNNLVIVPAPSTLCLALAGAGLLRRRRADRAC
jgi:hypothetical protein